MDAQQGVFYVARQVERDEEEETVLELLASYAFRERRSLSNGYRLREGLVGQCAFERQRILLTNVPSDYIRISSGLGEASPLNIVVLPVDRQSTRLNSTHYCATRLPSPACKIKRLIRP